MRAASISASILFSSFVVATAGLAEQGIPSQVGANASGLPPAVALRMDAPVGCRDRTAFVEEVRARAPHFAPSPASAIPTAGETLFAVTITSSEGGYAGTLRVERAGTSSERRILGHSCDEVSNALVLMVALAVDPTASTALSSPDAAAPVASAAPNTAPASSATPVSSAIAAPLPNAGVPVGVASTMTPLGAPARDPRFDVPRGEDASTYVKSPYDRRAVSLGVELLGQAGLAPNVALGGALLAEARPQLAFARYLVIRLSLGYASAGTSHTSILGMPLDVAATFRVGLARLDVCPWRLRFDRVTTLMPCAGLTGTLTFAAGAAIDGAQNRSIFRLYGELGPLLDWDLSDALFAGAQLAAVFPIVPASDRYVFQGADGSAIEAYAVPRIAGAARIGVGVRFR